jgi:hypothetical protein
LFLNASEGRKTEKVVIVNPYLTAGRVLFGLNAVCLTTCHFFGFFVDFLPGDNIIVVTGVVVESLHDADS